MSRPPASEAEARELIDLILEENGYLSEDTLGSIPLKKRKKVENAFSVKDQIIGSSVLTLAKNLYTSNARFVFELLQNTDDNIYETAQAAGQEPFVSFTLYPDKLVVDCNEDGFTGTNLRAICAVGQSSKSSSQGYIGEKGIGFKSVFMAAYKVHIQSGYLSFSFVHHKGEDGMGMLKPIREDPPGALPQLNYTRITLFLHDSGDAEERRRERGDIRDQFREIEPALLLFVRKLKCVEVTFRNEKGQQTWATRLTKCQAAEVNRAVLERRVADEESVCDVDPETHIYHVTKHIVTNVARHDNRKLSRSERNSPSSRESKILLAFPITAQSVPVIETQKVFAFLPMKQMGFNFLIQADFVTQANREDVVETSPRNQDLIEGVVDAFITTIRQFCRHESLQYTWMRYLPREGTHNWDRFWMKLVDGIKRRLKYEYVIRTRDKGVLRRIPDVKDRLAVDNDQHGKPLLPDLDPEIYLSDSYAGADIRVLHEFGLNDMAFVHDIACLERDLAQPGDASRMRSPSTEDNWHTRVSRLLLIPFVNGWESEKPRMAKLPILPLEDGSWVRADQGEIFYGTVGKIPIPGDLGLQLIATKAAENSTRRELFDNLGVRSASTKIVRSRILGMYTRRNMSDLGIKNSLAHLRFLYLTHKSMPDDEPYAGLCIYSLFGGLVRPLVHVVYIQDDHPYGAQSLLGPEVVSSHEAFFVNPRYLENPPKTPSGMELSWGEWMYEAVGVTRNIRVAKSDGTGLSWECKHIADHHSDKFLGFLKHVWPEQGRVMEDAKVLAELKQIFVPCTNGTTAPLYNCYTPLRKLRSIQSRFSDTDILPFFDVSSSSDGELLSQWSFLTDTVGVSCEDDLWFRLDLITACVGSGPESMTKTDALKFFDLYKYIAAYCMASEDPEKAKTLVRSYFGSEGLILGPSHHNGLGGIEWDLPEDCLWEAPLAMETMTPLKALYENAGLGPDLDGMRHFFQEILGIPDVGHMYVTMELEDISTSERERDVGSLYDLLQEMYDEDNSISSEISDAFKEYALVYAKRAGSSGWYSPSQCLWASETNIDGKVAISAQYPHLENLFTKALSVPRVNLTMVHDELLNAASNGATPERIKELLLDLSSHLQSEPNRPQPNRVLQRPVFPVRGPGDNDVTLCSNETEFFIVDREDLFNAFADRVRCLDFSLKEVCHLRPFIVWAGLESRFLSRSVEEVSRVQGGVERPIRDPNRDVKKKAFALLRIAAKHRSPRYEADPQALYDTLRTAETVETAGIASTLVLRQDGRAHEHEVSKSQLHIEDREGRLKIYVPSHEKALGACIYNTLPRRLLSWIMASPGSTGSVEDAAVPVTICIVACDLAAVDSTLEFNGVPSVDDVHEVPETVTDVPDLPGTPAGRNEYSTLSPGEVSSVAVTPERLLLSPDYGNASYATPLTDPGMYETSSDGSGRIPSLNVRLWPGESKAFKEAYALLLDSAVVAAEKMARLDYSMADVADALDSLSLHDDDVFTSMTSVYDLSVIQGRYPEIGAAGELFVFVLLSSLEPSLPSFGRDNWQSTIRSHAAAHPRFAGMANWVGRETSDIVYDDASGVLTDLLMTKGHLSEDWTQKTPRYYIEVKSTLDRCETPFLVSHGQAERMRTTTNGPFGCDNQDTIYAVFRVFNLGRESTGLRIYVDPEEQRRKGRLMFEPDAKYRVRPGVGV